MDGVLEAVNPLVDLLDHAADPSGFAEQLLQAASATSIGASAQPLFDVCAAHHAERALIAPVLHAAQLTDRPSAAATVTAAAVARAAAAQAVRAQRATDHWQLVLTVPGFLRGQLAALTAGHPSNAVPRETVAVLPEIAGSARQRLIIAAPYLHAGFVQHLAEPVTALLSAGGSVVVLTRALSLRAPEKSTANAEAVALLRDAATTAAAALGTSSRPALRVCSWEERGLGLHFKTVVADGQRAYLGSSNLTPGGTLGHAEGGVLLCSPRVALLENWLLAVADELDVRRQVAAPAGQ